MKLHVPAFEELLYRKEHLNENPDTMSYNRGYDLGIPEYNPETGCIAFPREHWQTWYNKWCLSKERFYAYIEQDGNYIGEVCLYPDGGENSYEMGIVIEACHRKKGHSREAMRLLLSHAFDTMHAKAVTNRFEATRTAALSLHLACGFTVTQEEDGCVTLMITRENYKK